MNTKITLDKLTLELKDSNKSYPLEYGLFLDGEAVSSGKVSLKDYSNEFRQLCGCDLETDLSETEYPGRQIFNKLILKNYKSDFGAVNEILQNFLKTDGFEQVLDALLKNFLRAIRSSSLYSFNGITEFDIINADLLYLDQSEENIRQEYLKNIPVYNSAKQVQENGPIIPDPLDLAVLREVVNIFFRIYIAEFLIRNTFIASQVQFLDIENNRAIADFIFKKMFTNEDEDFVNKFIEILKRFSVADKLKEQEVVIEPLEYKDGEPIEKMDCQRSIMDDQLKIDSKLMYLVTPEQLDEIDIIPILREYIQRNFVKVQWRYNSLLESKGFKPDSVNYFAWNKTIPMVDVASDGMNSERIFGERKYKTNNIFFEKYIKVTPKRNLTGEPIIDARLEELGIDKTLPFNFDEVISIKDWQEFWNSIPSIKSNSGIDWTKFTISPSPIIDTTGASWRRISKNPKNDYRQYYVNNKTNMVYLLNNVYVPTSEFNIDSSTAVVNKTSLFDFAGKVQANILTYVDTTLDSENGTPAVSSLFEPEPFNLQLFEKSLASEFFTEIKQGLRAVFIPNLDQNTIKDFAISKMKNKLYNVKEWIDDQEKYIIELPLIFEEENLSLNQAFLIDDKVSIDSEYVNPYNFTSLLNKLLDTFNPVFLDSMFGLQKILEMVYIYNDLSMNAGKEDVFAMTKTVTRNFFLQLYPQTDENGQVDPNGWYYGKD